MKTGYLHGTLVHFETCPRCKGKGNNLVDGTCSACNGTGEIIINTTEKRKAVQGILKL